MLRNIIPYGIENSQYLSGAQVDFSFGGLPERLRQLIDASGLKQIPFAEMVSAKTGVAITQSRISILARGKLEPSLKEIEMIAYACGVSPGWLAFNRGEGLATSRDRATRRAGKGLTRVVDTEMKGKRRA